MARIYRVQNNFTAGQLGLLTQQRYEFPKYLNGVKELNNFIVTTQGPISRRPGSRFVAQAKTPTTVVRLIEFVFNEQQAYILEFGPQYVRFFTDRSQITDGGLPVEVATPYLESELFELQFAQLADTLFIAHRNRAVAELVRFSDIDWRYQALALKPAPSQEFGLQPATTLVLSATSGLGVLATSVLPSFLESDVDRRILETEGPGEGVITLFQTASDVTMDVVSAFSTIILSPKAWTLTGSPRADLLPDKTEPIGARVTLDALREQLNEPDLILNGDFAQALTSWTSYSPDVITSGTDDSGTNNKVTQMTDTTSDFVALGVLVGHRIFNETDGGEGFITTITTTTNPNDTLNFSGGLTGGSDNDFDDGDAYRIEDTSTVSAPDGAADLLGGTQGIAWLEQSIATEIGRVYRVEFDVIGTALSAQAGSVAQSSNLFAEATFNVGNDQSYIFTATTSMSFIQFRNNQNAVATLDNVSAKLFSSETFRAEDVGKFIKLSSGVVEITELVDATQVRGIIRKTLAVDTQVPAGAWTLEEEVWSDLRGHPGVVTLFEQRLWLGGTASFPLDIWFSRLGIQDDFAAGLATDDSGRFTIASREVNQLQWLVSDNEIVAGTEREPFIITGGPTSIVTPTSIIVRSPTEDGASKVRPQRIGNAIVFVQNDNVVVRELLFNDNVGDRETADLTILSDDITVSGVVDLAYQQTPQTTLWVVLANGTLLSAAYLRRQDVIGWSRHPTQGAVQSVAIIPFANEDQIWLAVSRAGGVFIEYLDTADGFYGELTLDSALSFSGAATTTLSGLSHLALQEVVVLGEGANFGTFTVTASGTVSPLQLAVTQADVGLSYEPAVETLRPPQFGPGGVGPTIGFPIYANRVVVRLIQTLGLRAEIGSQVREVVPFRAPLDAMGQVPSLFSGDKVIDGGLNVGGFDSEATVRLIQADPLPCTIQSITTFGEVADN